ncbi:hypothetical protein [Myxococcus xanthus]|uniref:hypothetical protein n=1 Tax=Myxococcus xanthus TaxID=34 RepID=UPI00112AB94D|nr:hypothetical protein [Myxococcus xanthus]QDE80818.1 hypothetical protein BHS07_04205 [Myxococcus xanthus]
MTGHDDVTGWIAWAGGFVAAVSLVIVVVRLARRKRRSIWTHGQRARARLVNAEAGVLDRNRQRTTVMTFQVDGVDGGAPWMLVQQRTLSPEHGHLLAPGTELEVIYLPEAQYSAVVIPRFDGEDWE